MWYFKLQEILQAPPATYFLSFFFFNRQKPVVPVAWACALALWFGRKTRERLRRRAKQRRPCRRRVGQRAAPVATTFLWQPIRRRGAVINKLCDGLNGRLPLRRAHTHGGDHSISWGLESPRRTHAHMRTNMRAHMHTHLHSLPPSPRLPSPSNHFLILFHHLYPTIFVYWDFRLPNWGYQEGGGEKKKKNLLVVPGQ